MAIKDMKHDVKREKLKVQMIILAALAAVFIMMLPNPVVAFYYEAIPDDIAPPGFELGERSSDGDFDYSKKAGCLLEGGQKTFVKYPEGHVASSGSGYSEITGQKWSYQEYDELMVWIGVTDDVDCAMKYIQELGDKDWGFESPEHMKEKSFVRRQKDLEFWEIDSGLRNHWLYAYECTYDPKYDPTGKKDSIWLGRGAATVFEFSGNTFVAFKAESAATRCKRVSDSFREDVFFPAYTKIPGIQVPRKPAATPESTPEPTQRPTVKPTSAPKPTARPTPEPTPIPTTTPTPTATPTTGTVEVYVNNECDEELSISLYIDDYSKCTELVPSGASNYHFRDYELSPGNHKFKIAWNDWDIFEWYEDESTATISVGKTTTVTLTATKPAPTTGTAKVYVNNEWHKKLQIKLYIDDHCEARGYVPTGASDYHFRDYELSAGHHTFKIKWTDPDSHETCEDETSKYISAGEKTSVTLTAEKREVVVPTATPTPEIIVETPVPAPTTGRVKIYINNQDDDKFIIYLFTDNEPERLEPWKGETRAYNTVQRACIVLSGTKEYYGYIDLSPGHHSFKIKWKDPDTYELYEATKSQYISTGETTTVTLTATKHEEIKSVDESPGLAKLKKSNLDLTKPEAIYGITLTGMTEADASRYESAYILGTIQGVGGYASPAAASWEEVARYEFLSGKANLKHAKTLGSIETLDDILDIAYAVVSFKEACKGAPSQLKTLRGIKSSTQLAQNVNTLIDFTGNMGTLYDTAYKADRATAIEVGIPEADSKAMMIIGAVSTGGWSLLADLSNAIFEEKFVEHSVNYELEMGILRYMVAYHAQEMHEISTKKELSEQDIEQYFEHAERILILKRLEKLLYYRDQVYIFKQNPDFTTRAFSFFGISDTNAELEAKKENLNYFIDLYDHAWDQLKVTEDYLEVMTYET